MNDRDPNRLNADDTRREAGGHARPSREFDGFSGESHPSRENTEPRPGGSTTRVADSAASAARREAAASEVEEKKGGMTAGLWLALILGIVVLVALLIFVVQNNVPTDFDYMSWQFSLPLGVAMLLAAIAGALIMALVGSVRMMQLSLQVRRYRKAHARLQETLKL